MWYMSHVTCLRAPSPHCAVLCCAVLCVSSQGCSGDYGTNRLWSPFTHTASGERLQQTPAEVPVNITLPHTITGRGGESSASASASASAWSRVCLLPASLCFADAYSYSVVAWGDVTCVCVCV
jgi:hypothetical protein